jgi:hypothetical protein
LKLDLNVDVLTVQQLFVMPEIDASTLAKLICNWVQPNTISRMIIPVTCAFLNAIASVPDGESTFQLLRHFHQQNVQHRIRLCNEVVAKGNAANTANFTDHNVKQDIGRFFMK